MSRCREFDIDDALDQALNAFWNKGYSATTMTNLMAVMGLSKSSFYECFGSKRAALLAALSRYSARELTEARRQFSAGGPVAPRLAAWVRHSIDPAACRPNQRCGCLIVNIAVELAPHDREIEDAVRRHLDMLAAFLAEAIQQGQEDGSISSGFEPARSADMLLNLIGGIQVLAKGGVETQRLAAIIEVQLHCLLGEPH